MAYEDFTTYTEVDPSSDITVESATRVSWVGLRTRYDTLYVYKDKGVDHFNGDFTHKFEMRDSVNGFHAHTFHWALTNSIKDFYGVYNDNENGLFLFNYDGSYTLYLRIVENGVLFNDTWTDNVSSDTYYIEIVRDDDGGANNTGRLTAYIRTGSHTGTLKDTLVVDSSVGEQNDFRYVYAVTGSDDNENVLGSDGFTQNLDIGETPSGWTGKLSGTTNPAKINGVAVANIATVMGQ